MFKAVLITYSMLETLSNIRLWDFDEKCSVLKLHDSERCTPKSGVGAQFKAQLSKMKVKQSGVFGIVDQ